MQQIDCYHCKYLPVRQAAEQARQRPLLQVPSKLHGLGSSQGWPPTSCCWSDGLSCAASAAACAGCRKACCWCISAISAATAPRASAPSPRTAPGSCCRRRSCCGGATPSGAWGVLLLPGGSRRISNFGGKSDPPGAAEGGTGGVWPFGSPGVWGSFQLAAAASRLAAWPHAALPSACTGFFCVF